MQRLIKEGSDIEAWYSDGQTPLFKAVVLGNPRMAKLLLDHKAKPDHVDNQRAMPLEYAVALGNCPSNSSRDSGTFDIPGVVDVLLKSNPDMLIARNKLQLTPTGVAISCGNSEMAKLLLQYPGGDIEQGVLRMLPLCHAALKANEAMIDVFLQGGVSLKGTDGRFGRNALSWAISQGNKAAFTRLLQIPRFRWDDVDRMGRTPWTLLAVVEGHTTFFEELRSRDSDVHRPDRFGLTLFAAAQHGYCRIVWQILKNSPLKHKPKDRFGRSLTWWIRLMGFTRMREVLTNRGMQLEDEGQGEQDQYQLRKGNNKSLQTCDACTLNLSRDNRGVECGTGCEKNRICHTCCAFGATCADFAKKQTY